MAIRTFEELRERAKGLGPRRVVVASADDDVALTAAAEALRLGIALPVLAGDLRKIRELGGRLGLRELLDRAEFLDAPNDAGVAAMSATPARAIHVGARHGVPLRRIGQWPGRRTILSQCGWVLALSTRSLPVTVSAVP